MRYLQMLVIPLLLLVFIGNTQPIHAAAPGLTFLDQETMDRLTETYDLEVPETKYQPNLWMHGDFGMSYSTGDILHLVTIPLQPLPFLIRNLIDFFVHKT